jgi:hypothetical protein
MKNAGKRARRRHRLWREELYIKREDIRHKHQMSIELGEKNEIVKNLKQGHCGVITYRPVWAHTEMAEVPPLPSLA